jgi:hypothetical protein
MENTVIYYSEKQKINKVLSALIIIFAGVLPIGSYVYMYFIIISVLKQPIFAKSTSMFIFSGLIVFLLSLFIIYLFLTLKLEITFAPEGIFFRFFPFHRKFRFIPYSEIKYFTIRKFKPILEYGGWGIRYSLKRNGIAYTLSGNYGLQLELNSYKRILIGVKSPEKVLSFLKSIIPNKYFEEKNESK